MSDQTEALRLAGLWEKHSHGYARTPEARTAICLRRQHAEIESAHRAQREAENELSRALATHAMAEAELKAECDALRAALKFIADHDLSGTDLTVAGHIAHALIGKARVALKEAK